MTQPNPAPSRVAVVGGGISGLAAAHRIVELAPQTEIVLLEARPRLGGVLETIHEHGFQVETSADNFITTVPWGVDLCRRLGLDHQLVQTNPAYRRTFVMHRRRLYTLPDGFLMMAPTKLWPLALTPLLSPWGKLRAALEYFIPPRRDDRDESMAAFVRRRLGREVFQRLVEPLVSGVYAADMEKLSLLATLPRFRQMERDHGSLIRAMRAAIKAQRKAGTHVDQSGARYSMFVTLEEGLTGIVRTIARRLPPNAVRLATPVERIERAGHLWKLALPDGNTETAHAVILATPSPVAARLLRPLDAELGRQLAQITHEGTAIVALAFRSDQIAHPLNGAGFVVPAAEGSPILAGSFSSQKYPHRAPPDKVLIRAFVGGARAPQLATMDDDQLVPLVLRELDRVLHITGDPVYVRTAHWPGTMPQYHVGHRELVERIEARTADLPGIQLAGNAYHGVGLPNCIHSGEQAAQRILGSNSLGSTGS